MKKMRKLQYVIMDIINIISARKDLDKITSMYYNKKKELIVKINLGVVECS